MSAFPDSDRFRRVSRPAVDHPKVETVALGSGRAVVAMLQHCDDAFRRPQTRRSP
jgi:hypothetical protein